VVPLILENMYRCSENFAKYSKMKHQEYEEDGKSTKAHLVGSANIA
jgi:hypothetical protein